MKIKKSYLLLVGILFLGALLRLYRLPEMANFDFDQEYASNFAYAVLKEYPIQLIGQGLSIQGLFMGPLYFYYLVPFYALTSLHPFGGYIGSVILGLITIFVYFWVAKEIFGIAAGLVVAFFRAILFSFLEIEWSLTPAFSSDIMVIITLYLFYKYWHGKTNSIVPLAFCFGLFTSFHPILFPFYFVFVFIVLLRRKYPTIKNTIFSIIAFLLPITPLIIFEYLHSFLEIKQLFLLFGGSPGNKNYLTFLINYLNINLFEPQRILGISNVSKLTFTFIFFTFILLLVIKNSGFWKDSFHKIFLTTTSLIFIFYYLLLPSHVPEYYFSAIGILIIFYAGASLSLLAKKALPLLLAILIIIFYYNYQLLTNRWNNQSLITLIHKDFIVKEIIKRQPKNQEFYVSYIKNPGWNFGFDYLFKLYGQIPQTKEAKQPIYTIVIPKALSEESTKIKSGNIGLILPE